MDHLLSRGRPCWSHADRRALVGSANRSVGRRVAGAPASTKTSGLLAHLRGSPGVWARRCHRGLLRPLFHDSKAAPVSRTGSTGCGPQSFSATAFIPIGYVAARLRRAPGAAGAVFRCRCLLLPGPDAHWHRAAGQGQRDCSHLKPIRHVRRPATIRTNVYRQRRASPGSPCGPAAGPSVRLGENSSFEIAGKPTGIRLALIKSCPAISRVAFFSLVATGSLLDDAGAS